MKKTDEELSSNNSICENTGIKFENINIKVKIFHCLEANSNIGNPQNPVMRSSAQKFSVPHINHFLSHHNYTESWWYRDKIYKIKFIK